MGAKSKALTIFMPMAGEGRRIQPPQSQPVFKPSVEVNGKALYQWSLQGLAHFEDAPVQLIVTQQQCQSFAVESMIENSNHHLCVLDQPTRGPLETLYLALQKVKPAGPIISLDCDLLFTSKAFLEFLYGDSADWAGALLYFEAQLPVYSFLKKQGERAIEVREKQAISSFAICGCYYFSSSQLVVDHYNKVISETKGEPYLSHLYQSLIENGHPIKAIPIDSFQSLGTFQDIKNFEEP